MRPLLRFTQIEAASGIVLLAGAALALVWANSPWLDGYLQLFQQTRFEMSLGPLHLNETLGHLINDGLMAVFFFVVGLEIKREIVLGDLRDRKAATLPVVAALGGMIVPALIYVAFAGGIGPEVMRGWAIPMATDIAFVVGVIALHASRVPPGAKLFVLALAIADDLGAIAVIAIFYTSDLNLGWLGVAATALVAVWVSEKVGIRSLAWYVPLALAVWFATLESGVHATLAGVALGFLTPARSLYGAAEFEHKAASILNAYPIGDATEDQEKSDYEAELLAEIATESIPPLNRLELKLLPWTSFVIVPLFALANAGVNFDGANMSELILDRVALGVALGLVVGKTIGISAFSWLAVHLGWAKLPKQTQWNHIVALASLAGIGFTVSLFVTNLAFTGPELGDTAKIGIFTGSALAGMLGSLLLQRTEPHVEEPDIPLRLA